MIILVYFTGKKHALRKKAQLPNHKSILIAVYLYKNIHGNIFGRLPDQFDTLFHPKNTAETNAIKLPPLSIGQLEKRTSSRATDVF